MPKTKLLIFDFDGTLVDSAPGIHKAMNLVARELGIQEFSFDLIKKLIGYGLNHMLQSLDLESKEALKSFPEMRARFLEVYQEISLNEVSFFPGLLDFLNQSPHLLAIASNKEQKPLRHLVSRTELNKIQWIGVSGADTFSEKKPHPMPLIQTMKMAEVLPEETIMIGDGLPDALSSQKAQVPFIGVNFGYASESDLIKHGAKHIMSHYSQLPAFIEKIDQDRV